MKVQHVLGVGLWVGKEGVFIDWSVAAADIANLLARDSFAGIPKDPDTLADLLVSANLLQLNGRGARYWTIALPGTFEAKEGLVKLREGEVIFPQGFDFEPYKNVQLTLTPTTATQATRATQQSAPSASGAKQPAKADSPAPKQELDAPPLEEIPRYMQDNEPPPEGSLEPPPAAAARKDRKRNKPKPEEGVGQGGGIEEDAQSDDSRPTAQESDSGASLGVDVSPTAAKLLGSLKRTNAWLLNEVMQAYRNDAMTGVGAALPYGFGISHEELNRHGIPVMELLEELGLKAWLWQDKTRASRRIHPVEIDGKTHRMVILKPDIASGLGFDMTPKE